MKPFRIVFFLVPNFSMIAFATALEPLRLANRILEKKVYEWQVATVDGEPAVASNGVSLNTDISLEELRVHSASGPKPDMVLVCSGIHVDRFNSTHLNGWLRSLHRHGTAVGGLCTGAWVLGCAGLLDGKRCAIHWENLPGFAEKFPEAEVHADLSEVDSNIYTCAGGTAALDMMLHMIGGQHDEALVTQICEQCMVDRIRNPQDRQRLPLQARLGLHNSKLMSTIELMEANIPDPLPLTEISAYAGLSRRHIERLFRQHLGRSPARYYLEIRLDRARHLLIQSMMPVVEVAIACGFVSASHFSKCYREMYGRSPQMERSQSALTLDA